MKLDKVVHEPGRLSILVVLEGGKEADFNSLLKTLGLTRGNLSRHIGKLQTAGYIKVNKTFKGKIPHTSYQITTKGSAALAEYWQGIDAFRQLGR